MCGQNVELHYNMWNLYLSSGFKRTAVSNIFGEPVIPVQITYMTNSKLRIVGVFVITELKNNAYENANNLPLYQISHA
jgi:predicted transcriptional regulator